MAVLRIRKEKGYKLVAANIPNDIYSFMSLYTMARGMPRTAIFTQLMEKWVRQVKENTTEEELLQALIERIDKQWKLEKGLNSRLQFTSFSDALVRELEDKGIKKEYIEKIIEAIR
jgi:hypothetical protein